jgi:hypothetical protein
VKKILLLLVLVTGSGYLRAQNYVIFLHNMFTELYPLNEVHPEYGRCEYPEIVAAFRKEGFIVLSEKRPKGTNGDAYAQKVAMQVDSLIAKGIKPSHITVIGTSKGGYIAQVASGLLKNTNINYVFIGCCDDSTAMHYYGNVLSIYEHSDVWHSCKLSKDNSGNSIKHFKEIELNTGKKHGFLYHPLDEWIKPSVKWAKQDYN